MTEHSQMVASLGDSTSSNSDPLYDGGLVSWPTVSASLSESPWSAEAPNPTGKQIPGCAPGEKQVSWSLHAQASQGRESIWFLWAQSSPRGCIFRLGLEAGINLKKKNPVEKWNIYLWEQQLSSFPQLKFPVPEPDFSRIEWSVPCSLQIAPTWD